MNNMHVSEFVAEMKEQLDHFEKAYKMNQEDNPEQFPSRQSFWDFFQTELPIFLDSDNRLCDAG